MKKLLPLLLLPAATVLFANETTVCTLNNSERIIDLTSTDSGCEVRYTKGGETKTLWSSPRAEYCAPHAADFIEKQKGWGYQCTAKPVDNTATTSQ
jgi:hypothetical protein